VLPNYFIVVNLLKPNFYVKQHKYFHEPLEGKFQALPIKTS
jgi:hypothetical protein